MLELTDFERVALLAATLPLLAAVGGCGDDEAKSSTGIAWTTSSGAGGTGGTSSGGQGGAGGGGAGGGAVLCPTEFTFTSAEPLQNVRLAGEWHGFDLSTATPMSDPGVTGEHTATIDLPPGMQAYKIVYEQDATTHWIFDPQQTRRKYIDNIENSARLVPDCTLPRLLVQQSQASYHGPGQGIYEAVLSYHDAIDGSGPDPSGFEGSVTKDFVGRQLTAAELSVAADGTATVSLSALSEGKHTVSLRARSQSGQLGDPLRLIFWIEAEPFSWEGALIYMVMLDRFRDGDSANSPGPTAGVDPRADWQGGDLEGLRQRIADGTLDQLGISALWLSPFQENPAGAYPAAGGVHQVTGYHGYWPIKARQVDPRLGGEQALRDLVIEAHAHGIRILQDYVINHVHEEHEYNLAHPSWFRTGCVCGTPGCDWTEHALDCLFSSFMPDIDHRVFEANTQLVDDAVFWLDSFDLDGLRVDAVKHVEQSATRNLSAAVREGFEAAGTRYFLMGETAMGWSECADPCNDENYGTIAKYIGPHGLDGQFDFVLYHGVSYRTFAYGGSTMPADMNKGMLHADYWLQHGLSKWPAGAIMTPYLGSHDTPRFASLADYRSQDATHFSERVGNQWDDPVDAPSDAEPYRRLRLGLTWLLGLPGAPLLYYGDEYGQWGGADPNNRQMWRDESQLTADEAATLAYVQKLGQARRQLTALQHGAYISLGATEETLVFARHVSAAEVAVVGLTRATADVVTTVDVSVLGLSSGTVLHDALGGPDVPVAGSSATLTIPAGGGVILAP